ncbi:71_t:CDS:2, partial [Paraglomus occultum]
MNNNDDFIYVVRISTRIRLPGFKQRKPAHSGKSGVRRPYYMIVRAFLRLGRHLVANTTMDIIYPLNLIVETYSAPLSSLSAPLLPSSLPAASIATLVTTARYRSPTPYPEEYDLCKLEEEQREADINFVLLFQKRLNCE